METCAICHLTPDDIGEVVKETERRTVLNINHGVKRLPDHDCNLWYHIFCIDSISNSCPYCRKDVSSNVEEFKSLFNLVKIDILKAMKENNMEMIRKFLYEDVGISFRDSDENTLLHLATSVEQVKLFLEEGISRLAENRYEQTPFKKHLRANHYDIVKFFASDMTPIDKCIAIAYGVNGDSEDFSNLPIDLQTVQILAEGVYREIAGYGNGIGEPVLHLVKSVEMAEFFVQIGCDPRRKDIYKRTALIKYIRYGLYDLVRFILPFLTIEEKNEGLFYICNDFSCRQWSEDMIEELLQGGADLHADSDHCFVNVCKYRRYDMIAFLLKKGSDLHAQNDEGFMKACQYNHCSSVEVLLNHGIDIQSCGLRALIAACKNNKHDSIFEFLVNKGAPLYENLEECFLTACRYNNLPVVEYLYVNGTDIETFRIPGLLSCCQGRALQVALFLLKKGADVPLEVRDAVEKAFPLVLPRKEN